MMRTFLCARPWSLLAAACSLSAGTQMAHALVYAPFGSVWRYLDTGSEQGTAWRAQSFDDSTWPSGPGSLGFGGDGEQTVLQGGHITHFFRHAFTATALPATSNLLVRLKRDDGAIVYLNGTEVFRSNMPAGAVDYLTLASSAVSGADETNVFFSSLIAGSLLVNGINVVAVEVHQAAANSGDLGFDLELSTSPLQEGSLAVAWPQGFSFIGNPTSPSNSTLNDLFPSLADGTEFRSWNLGAQSYDVSVLDGSSFEWIPNRTFGNGEGALVNSPTPQVTTYATPIQEPPVSATRPSTPGRRLVGCRWPVASTFEEVLGFPPAEGDKLQFFDGVFQSVPTVPTQEFIFSNNGWLPNLPPLVQPGQAVFVDLVAIPPPTIVQQPPSQTVNEGDMALFFVGASGTPPIQFQWQKSGLPIPGATLSFFGVTNATPNDAAAYSVVVANPGGSVTSSNAFLTVRPLLTNRLFINEWLASNATGLRDEDGELSDWIELFNAYDSPLDVGGAYLANSAANPTLWPIPEGTVVPPHGHWLVFASAKNRTRHTNFQLGDSGGVIQLHGRDGTTLVDAISYGRQTTNISQGRCPDGEASIYFMNPTPDAANSCAASSCVGIVCPTNRVVDCTSSTGPTGAVVNFSVTATNRCFLTNEVDVLCHPPSGTLFVVGTTTVFCEASSQVSARLETNHCSFTVTVLDNCPPVITQQPQSQTVIEGNPLTLSVTAAGSPPLSYRWQRNTATIAGATNSILTIPQTTTNDAGTYTVVVANPALANGVLSSNAVVTIGDTCPIIVCPANITTNCQGPVGAVVTYEVFGGNPCNPTDFDLVCTPPSGSVFPPGSTTVNCLGRAPRAGRQAPCDFIVTVLSNCSPVQPNITLSGQPSDIALKLDRFFYGPTNQVRAELNLGTHQLGVEATQVLLVSEKARDVEVVALARSEIGRFTSGAPISLGFGEATARFDARLQVQHGDVLWAFWKVGDIVAGGPVGEGVVAAFALAADQFFTDSPQHVIPSIALTQDERVIPAGGKPISTLFVPGTLPVQFPVDELVAYPADDAQLAEILRVTGGWVLAAELTAEEQSLGKRGSYLIHVNPSSADPLELPAMRAFIGATEPLLAGSEAGLRVVALALKLQLQGYPVGLNPRLQYQGVPRISDREMSNLPQSLTHPVFDFPKGWAFLALMDADTRPVRVAFLDQGFNVNRDFRRPAIGPIPQCDFEGRDLEGVFRGFACEVGAAESTPTVGGSLVLDPMWHGNGVVSIAGAVANNDYGVAGTGGQIVEPMLYRYGLVSYAFEMGLGIRRAVRDQAQVINLSASFPCRIQTWLGLDPNWCDRGGRALFCLELPLHVAHAAGAACASGVECDVPIFCDIVEEFARVVCGVGGGVISLGTLTPACLLTIPFIQPTNPLDAAIQDATRAGVPVVTVAGNALRSEDFPEFLRPILDLSSTDVSDWAIWPALQPDTIVCGSAESDWPFANLDFQGSRVDIWAPVPGSYMGPSTVDALESDDSHHVLHSDLWGTSAAAPYISGLIADMMALNPRLDPSNPLLSPTERQQIPLLIKSLLRDTAYTRTGLAALAPAGSEAETLAKGELRRNLVNPLNALRGAAFRTLPGTAGPALPDFTALGYDANMDFDEVTDAEAADSRANAHRLVPGAAGPATGTILTLRGEGGVHSLTDRDYFNLQVPIDLGIWQAVVELTRPKDFEFLTVRDSSRSVLAGTRVMDTPVERTLQYRWGSFFPGSESQLQLTGVDGADNVYKLRLVRFDRIGDSPLPDRFDRNDASTPPESRPNNDVPERAGLLGRPGEFQWGAEAPTPGSISVVVTRAIRIPDLNLDNPHDADWFCVVPPSDVAAGPCGATLTINAGPGVRITVYHRGRPEVIADGLGSLSLPASLLEGTELCIRLTPDDPARFITYPLELRLLGTSGTFCSAVRRAVGADRGSGTAAPMDRGGEIPFPGIFPNLPAGSIPLCDPRVCDPAPSAGIRSLDSNGRIVTPDLYALEWNTFGEFNAWIELVAGNSLRVQLLDEQGQVLATAFSLPNPPTNSLSIGLPTLHLQRALLLPGIYVLKVDLGFPGTRFHLTLPRAATIAEDTAFEDMAHATPQPDPPGFKEWVTATIPNPAARDPNADPDQDRRSNTQEYAFGSNPMIPGDGRPTTISIPADATQGEVEIRFVRPTWITDMDYHLEGATTLALPVPWQTIQPETIQTRPLSPGLKEVTWRFIWREEGGFFRPGASPIPPLAGEKMRIGFFNFQMLAEPFTRSSPCCDWIRQRWEHAADRILKMGFDVIGLCEVQTSEKEALADILRRNGYDYYVQELSYRGASLRQDSGLMLFSKFPIVGPTNAAAAYRQSVVAYAGKYFRPREGRSTWKEWYGVAFAEFDDFDLFEDGCSGDDCWSHKGAGLVQIQHPESMRIYNVVFTHMQSGSGETERRVRAAQLSLIHRMVREVLGEQILTQPLVLMGDLNIPGNDEDTAMAGVQRDEWLERFGPDGKFVINLSDDGSIPPITLQDVWEDQNHVSDGLPDAFRDEGRTSSINERTAGWNRLDFLFLSAPPETHLAVQHMALAYGLKDLEPFHSYVAFGTEGEGSQLLSDHHGIIADINTDLLNCRPVDPIVVEFGNEPATNPEAAERITFNGNIRRPGGVQWYRINPSNFRTDPGHATPAADTFDISVESPDAGVKFDVFSTFELSRALLPDPVLSHGPATGGLSEPPVHLTTLGAVPRTYTPPDGSPLLVRVIHRDRGVASTYRIQFRRPRGLTRNDAIQLHANTGPYTVNLFRGWPTETGRRWFRTRTERALSRRPQFLQGVLVPQDGMHYHWSWVRANGETIADSRDFLMSARFAGGEDLYLVVELQNDASEFRIQWSTDLTVIPRGLPTASGNEPAVRLTGTGLSSVGLKIEVRHGASSYGFADLPNFRSRGWTSGSRYSLASVFDASQLLAFLPDEEVVVALQVVTMVIAPLPRETEYDRIGESNASFRWFDSRLEDTNFQFQYQRSHRSR